MTRKDAEYLVRQKGMWPIWVFLIVVYYFPAIYIAFTPDPCVGDDYLLARMTLVMWGLLAGIGSMWCLVTPFKAEKFLKKGEP